MQVMWLMTPKGEKPLTQERLSRGLSVSLIGKGPYQAVVVVVVADIVYRAMLVCDDGRDSCYAQVV